MESIGYNEYVKILKKCTWSKEDEDFLKLVEHWKKKQKIEWFWYHEWDKWERQIEKFEKYILEKRLKDKGSGWIKIEYNFKNIIRSQKEHPLLCVNIAGCLAYMFLHDGISEPQADGFFSERFSFKIDEKMFKEYLKIRNLSENNEISYSGGNLYYKHYVIENLTPLEKQLCKEMNKHDVNKDVKTIVVEETVYGNNGNDTERLRAIIKDLNKKVKNKFKIDQFIKFGSGAIRRLK